MQSVLPITATLTDICFCLFRLLLLTLGLNATLVHTYVRLQVLADMWYAFVQYGCVCVCLYAYVPSVCTYVCKEVCVLVSLMEGVRVCGMCLCMFVYMGACVCVCLFVHVCVVCVRE